MVLIRYLLLFCCKNRCAYFYDTFGNLEVKNCSSGVRRYIVDPFGLFGGDIIAEVCIECIIFNWLIIATK